MELGPKHEEKASLLRDAVLGADDGLVTTFAIISGSAGAGLSPAVVVILGLAKLLADGLSMASGVYMGAKSELEYEKSKGIKHWRVDFPLKQGLTAFAAFVLAGLMPLLPYLFNARYKFWISSLVLGLLLFTVGSFKSLKTGRNWLRGGLEMLGVGGGVAAVAYLVGFLVERHLV